ncbi:MAG: hypothetical protein KDA71_05730 [Planctomycetales bacterium]|nr:hypothetical protein [Planctomycetales bacterium]
MSDGPKLLAPWRWREHCPWLILLQTFSLAISMPILFCGTAGALLTPIGWRLSEVLFIGDVVDDDRLSAAGPVLQPLMNRNAHWPFPADVDGDELDTVRGDALHAWPYFEAVHPTAEAFPQPLPWIMQRLPGNSGTVYWRFVEPFRTMFRAGLNVREFAYLVFGCLWTVAVWAFFGGVITRIAVVRLGREEPMNFKTAVGYVLRKWRSYFAAPFMPLIGIFLIALPLALCGLLMRSDVGAAIIGFIYPVLLLLCGFFMVLLSIGLMFGWPLMWGAISSEQSGDGFEAFSRSFSYTFQRPLHYLFYALVALVFSALCWLVVSVSANAVIQLTGLGLATGSGLDRYFEIENAAGGAAGMAESLFDFGAGLVHSVAVGIMHGLFWCLAAAIYLLLRSNVDHTELDDVYLEDEHLERPMPELAQDSAGVAMAPESDSKQSSSEEPSAKSAADDEPPKPPTVDG